MRAAGDLLRLWSELLPENRVPWNSPLRSRAELGASGLREVGRRHGVPLLARRPSWILPARHPVFAFAGRFEPSAAFRAETLWNEGTWRPDEFRRLISRVEPRNWWLRHGDRPLCELAERVAKVSAVPGFCRSYIASRYPGAKLLCGYVIGSYLWAVRPSSRLDVVLVIDSTGERLLEHAEVLPLPSRMHWDVSGTRIEGLDAVVTSLEALRNPSGLTGRIGSWTMRDGRPYPYDNSRETVARALNVTLRSGLPIFGRDLFDGPADKADLLALAYYFLQEASILLAWRQDVGKAANRLVESSLIMGRPTEYAHLAALRTAVRKEPVEPELLSRLEGWHATGTTAALPDLIRRLVAERRSLGMHGAGSVPELVERARTEEWPTWRQARTELKNWISPGAARTDAQIAQILHDWERGDEHVPTRVRSHLRALGSPGPAAWLGDPWLAVRSEEVA